MLCVSTTQGVYIVDGQGTSRCLGLEGMIVSQIAVQGTAVQGTVVLAAVPELAEVCLSSCVADIVRPGTDSMEFCLSRAGHRCQI